MRQSRLAQSVELKSARPGSRNLLLVLAGVTRPPRRAESIANRTGLTLLEVESALAKALSLGWVDGRNRLTDYGRAELAQARRTSAEAEPLPSDPERYYCPTELRAPQVSFS
jgi:hypothetical protein